LSEKTSAFGPVLLHSRTYGAGAALLGGLIGAGFATATLAIEAGRALGVVRLAIMEKGGQ
jgi:hypothetical protein